MSLQSLQSSLPISANGLTDGMLVYNTNQSVGAKGVYYWKDSQWNNMAASTTTGGGGSWNVANTTESASSNTDAIYQMGSVGIGTNNPTAPLHVVATEDPLKLEGVSTGDLSQNSVLTLTSDGLVKKVASSEVGNVIASEASIPVPNVYSLKSDLTSFYKHKTMVVVKSYQILRQQKKLFLV